MPVIVTRPGPEAAQWIDALAQKGFDARPLPLINIEPAPDDFEIDAAWTRLPSCAAVMFVSSNAVHHFFEQERPQALIRRAWAAIKTRAWATGPATRDALLQAGVPAHLVDTPPSDARQFDSEALWQQVADQALADSRVMIVRGGDAQGRSSGRDWLAHQLTQAGAQVDTVVAYLRRAPLHGPNEQALAEAGATDGSVWVFSSSEGIANLQAWLPAQSWARARAVATHPRIAQAARDAGFGVVCPSRPGIDAVAASIESIR